MKLYVADYAPNPRRVLWLMREKAILDVAISRVDIMALEHRSHEIVLKSGASALPVLELDDGTVLAESVAICRYLESLYPEPNLFGETPREIAEIEMWLRRIEMHLATPLMLGVRMSTPALNVLEEPNQAVASYNLDHARAFLPSLDAHLTCRDFICANRLTMVDIVAACAFDFARIARFRPDTSCVNLARWQARMRSLASRPET